MSESYDILYWRLIYSTVMIRVNKKNKNTTGTGFIFSYDEKSDLKFLVTCKHVIENPLKIIASFKQTDEQNNKKPLKGKKIPLDLSQYNDRWIFRENIDIAIFPFNLIQDTYDMNYDKGFLFYNEIKQGDIPTEPPGSREIYAIEDVVYIGYPLGFYDTFNLTPILRAGITATPFPLDYNNIPTFLIDAPLFHGSSGSPVCIVKSAHKHATKTPLYASPFILFLGILSTLFDPLKWIKAMQKIENKEEIEEYFKKRKNFRDMGVVYKSFLLNDLVKDYLDKQ